MSSDDKQGEVAFNLGGVQLQIIGSLLLSSSTNWLNGDYVRAYWKLNKIRRLIVERLNETERKEMMIYESHIEKSIKLNKPSSQSFQKYETRIMELLGSKGFLVPLKEDRKDLYGRVVQ